MKKLAKLGLVLSLFAVSVMPAFAQNDVETASAATLWKGTATGYTKASDVKYEKNGKYIANWGARDEACTFLTSYATSFYTGSYTYEQLSLNAGSTSTSSVPSSALYKALNGLVKTKQTYQTSYDATKELFRYTDCVNSNYTYISSFYSAAQLKGAWDGAATWNREHTWPNSKLSGSGENDIMMLRPTSVSENSSRGNTAYGESSGYYDPNGEGQNVRGDCARIMLYVYTRWGTSNMWGKSGVMENKDVLLKWMEEDPVDTWEMGRNDATQAILGTRNVYVDYPELAWQLFGETAPSDMVTPSGKASNGTATPTPTPTPTPDPEDPEEDAPETPDTPTTPSVTSGLEEGVAYTVSASNTSGLLYLKGTITSGRFDCSTSVKDAVYVYVENVNGGQLLYMLNGNTKTYFVFDDKAGNSSTTPSASSATVFEWNADLKTLVVAEDSNNRAFGTKKADSYLNFSAYDANNGTTEYNWGQFTAVAGAEQPDQPETPVEPDTPVEPEQPDTPSVTSGLEEGVAYIVSASNSNGLVYLTSGITSSRFNGTTDKSDAIYVYVVNVSGGQLLYTMNGTTKTYFIFNDTSNGAATTTDKNAASVFEWNDNLKTLVVADDENNRAFGLDQAQSYTDFKTYAATNSYSWGQFTAVEGEQQPEPDQPDTPVQPEPDTPETPDTPTTPSTSKEIVAAAYALGTGEALDGEYTLTGEITNVKEYDSSTTNVCLTITVEGKEFYCHWMRDNANGDNASLAVGDTITVTGKIKNYYGKVEFEYPTLSTVVKAGVETPEDPDTPVEPEQPDNPDTPVEPDEPQQPTPDTPSESSGLAAGVAYIVSADNANGILYLTGAISEGRFVCSTNKEDAVRVYVEDVEGGQLLYMLNRKQKTYFVFEDKAAGGSTTTDATLATVFEWNEELSTLVVADDENNRAFGAGKTSTFDSFSAYDASQTDYNWGQFTAVIESTEPSEPDTPDTPDEPTNPDPETPDEPSNPNPDTPENPGDTETPDEPSSPENPDDEGNSSSDETTDSTEDGNETDSASDGVINDMLGNLTAGCEASIGASMAGMALLTVGFAFLKRKKEDE